MKYAFGEAWFGKCSYKIGAVSRLYYLLKPILSRLFTFWLHQVKNIGRENLDAPLQATLKWSESKRLDARI